MSDKETQETSGLNPRRHLPPKPVPRDFKREFEDCLLANGFSQQEYAAFLMTANIMLFERGKYDLLAMAINHTPHDKDHGTPMILHRLRRHDIL